MGLEQIEAFKDRFNTCIDVHPFAIEDSMAKMIAVLGAMLGVLVLHQSAECRAEEFKPPLSEGFYHITFQIADTDRSRVIEIRSLRADKAVEKGGFMDVTWVGMWPENLKSFLKAEPQDQLRTTGVFTPKAIKMVIPNIVTSREIDVYYFTFDPIPNKNGTYKGTGDVPYGGPNGAGKNQFTCEMEPLPNFKIPSSK